MNRKKWLDFSKSKLYFQMEIHYSRSSGWILSAGILHENIRQQPVSNCAGWVPHWGEKIWSPISCAVILIYYLKYDHKRHPYSYIYIYLYIFIYIYIYLYIFIYIYIWWQMQYWSWRGKCKSCAIYAHIPWAEPRKHHDRAFGT